MIYFSTSTKKHFLSTLVSAPCPPRLLDCSLCILYYRLMSVAVINNYSRYVFRLWRRLCCVPSQLLSLSRATFPLAINGVACAVYVSSSAFPCLGVDSLSVLVYSFFPVDSSFSHFIFHNTSPPRFYLQFPNASLFSLLLLPCYMS